MTKKIMVSIAVITITLLLLPSLVNLQKIRGQQTYVEYGVWQVIFYDNNTFDFNLRIEVWKGEVGNEQPLTDEEWEQYKSQNAAAFQRLAAGAMRVDAICFLGAATYDVLNDEFPLVISEDLLHLTRYFKGLRFDDPHHAYYQSWNIYWKPYGSDYSKWEKVDETTVKFTFYDVWHLRNPDWWFDYVEFDSVGDVSFVDAVAIHDSGEQIAPHEDTPTKKRWNWPSNGMIEHYEVTISYPALANLEANILPPSMMLYLWNTTTGFIAPSSIDAAFKKNFEKHLDKLEEKPAPVPGESAILVGGPIANSFVNEYNSYLGVSFEGNVLKYNGNSYSPKWKSEDYAVIGAYFTGDSYVFVVEGCTRYGTEAAASYIKRNLVSLSHASVYILKWVDNGNGKVDNFDTFEIVVGG